MRIIRGSKMITYCYSQLLCAIYAGVSTTASKQEAFRFKPDINNDANQYERLYNYIKKRLWYIIACYQKGNPA